MRSVGLDDRERGLLPVAARAADAERAPARHVNGEAAELPHRGCAEEPCVDDAVGPEDHDLTVRCGGDRRTLRR